MFLSKEELREFTGYQIVSCQIRALEAFGVPFKIGIHGRPIILKSEVEKFLGGTGHAQKTQSETEPNWIVLGA